MSGSRELKSATVAEYNRPSDTHTHTETTRDHWPLKTYFLQRAQCSHCKRCISYSNSVCLSVCPSVRPSHAGIVSKPKNIPQGRPLPPESLAQSDLPTPEGCEFWHVLPCIASTVRDRQRSSITVNKNAERAFQRAIDQGSTPPPNFLKMGIKMSRAVVFWTTMKDEKSAAKFHYIKTVSGKVVEHSIAFRVVSIYW